MEPQKDIVVIKENKNQLFFWMLIAIPFLIYYILIHITEHSDKFDLFMDWSVVALFGFTVIYAVIARLLFGEFQLKLTPEGFYVGYERRFHRSRLVKWTDIECFGIAKETPTGLFTLALRRNLLVWKLKYANGSQGILKRINKSLLGYDDAIYPRRFTLETGELASLLNEWKSRQTGIHAEIMNISPPFNRKVTLGELIFAIALTVFILFILFWAASLSSPLHKR